MRLRLVISGTLALGCLLLVPAGALAGNGSAYPAGDYAFTGDCDTGTRVGPIGVAFEGFSDPGFVQNKIDQQTARYDSAAWSTDANTGATWKVNMANNPDGTGIQCEPVGPIRLSPTEGGLRTRMRTFSNSTSNAVVGAPIRQEKDTTNQCGGTSANPVWIPTRHAYDEGRTDFESAFQGSTPFEGAYPMEEVSWGNTNSFMRCDGQTISGTNGNVTVIHPTDSFGFNIGIAQDSDFLDSGQQMSDDGKQMQSLLANGNQTTTMAACGSSADPIPTSTAANPVHFRDDVMAQWQAAGVDTLRFGINWATVQQCSGAPYHWAFWDAIFNDLSSHGIRPIVNPNGVPNPANGVDWHRDCSHTPPPNVTWGRIVNFADQGALTAYSNFVQAFATRYGEQTFGGQPYGRHLAIEILNESNSQSFFGGCEPNADNYLKILDAGVAGLNASGKNLQILPASPAPFGDTKLDHPDWNPAVPGSGRDHISTTDWFGGMFQDWSPTTKQTVDALGIHPYRGNRAVQPYESALNQLGSVQNVMANHAVDKPVWVTEDGTTVSGGPSSAGPAVGPYVGTRDSADDPYSPYPGTAAEQTLQGMADLGIYDHLRNDGVPVTLIHTYADFNTDCATTTDCDKVMKQSPNVYGVVRGPAGLQNPYPFGVKDAYCELAQERTGVLPASPPANCSG
jgi:hypothetical protein